MWPFYNMKCFQTSKSKVRGSTKNAKFYISITPNNGNDDCITIPERSLNSKMHLSSVRVLTHPRLGKWCDSNTLPRYVTKSHQSLRYTFFWERNIK